jgi:uncharacterized membrane protein
MAFCPNCGSQVEGRFCAKCGSAVGVDSGGPTASVPPGVTPAQSTTVQSSGMTDNVAAALCYLLGIITGVLFLVLEPYNRNKTIRFHAFQSIFFWVACVVLSIVFSILFGILVHIPVLGALVALALWPLFGLAMLAVWLFMMYKAYNNEKFMLPVIGELAQKQA